MFRREMSIRTTPMHFAVFPCLHVWVCIEYTKWTHNEKGCCHLFMYLTLKTTEQIYDDYGLLVCNTMYFSENLTFWRYILLPSSASKSAACKKPAEPGSMLSKMRVASVALYRPPVCARSCKRSNGSKGNGTLAGPSEGPVAHWVKMEVERSHIYVSEAEQE
jgi:hypothetical protein